MLGYILRRILGMIPVLLAISIIVFIIIQLPPGDYADLYKAQLISQGGMSPIQAEQAAQKFRKQYGLDKPVTIQYLNWISGIITKGSFGYSFSYRKDVGELIMERLPWTFLIAILSHIISTVLGLWAGIYVAQRQYSVADNAAAFAAFILTSVPRFTLALIVIYIMIFHLGVQNLSSIMSPQFVAAPWSMAKIGNIIQHIWPAIMIAGLGGVARNFRVMRGNLLDVINSQYVQTAQAKGLSRAKVIYKHAVPNALHPIVMYQGLVLPYMIQGSLIAAIVLGLPTMGPLFYASLINEDIYVAAGFLMIYSLLLVAGNLIADILLSVLDPRIRYS